MFESEFHEFRERHEFMQILEDLMRECDGDVKIDHEKSIEGLQELTGFEVRKVARLDEEAIKNEIAVFEILDIRGDNLSKGT